ncbi:MAG: glycosyltransferase [Desulfuromonadaceae bacterium]
MRISLCLLTWNEFDGCNIDIPRLPPNVFDEVYAVDGGSTDGTVEYLQSQGVPVYRQPKRGLNAAYHHAVDCSSCDAVVVFFPKGTIDPETLRNFRHVLESGIDLVVASRNMPGGRNEEDGGRLKIRKRGVQTLSLAASFMWRREGHKIRDVLHGYKGFSVSGFNRMNILREGLSVDIEMVIRSYRLKLTRTELPVVEVARPFGETRFKVLPTGIRLLKYLWFELRRPD